MELKRKNGDYVPDGRGGFQTVRGGEELLQRVIWRLEIPRGSFPFLPELGSQLHRLLRAAPAERGALARQYVAEALEAEAVTLDDVTIIYEGGDRARVRVELTAPEGGTTVELTVTGG